MPRARSAVAALALVLAVLIAGCGSSESEKAPRGNPDGRYGAAAVDTYASTELLRALVIASSDSYAAGGSAADARAQLLRARAAYDVLGARVRNRDPVLAREVAARFGLLQSDIRRGIAGPHYQALAGPLGGQLMDGVAAALVPDRARHDRGLQAEALRRVAVQLAATYDASAAGGDVDSRLAFQESWGLWKRATALAGLIKDELGSDAGKLTNSLNNLGGTAFPKGPQPPDSPPARKVDAVAQEVVATLNRRFALQA